MQQHGSVRGPAGRPELGRRCGEQRVELVKSKPNEYARWPAAKNSRLFKLRSSGGGPHRYLMLRPVSVEISWTQISRLRTR